MAKPSRTDCFWSSLVHCGARDPRKWRLCDHPNRRDHPENNCKADWPRRREGYLLVKGTLGKRYLAAGPARRAAAGEAPMKMLQGISLVSAGEQCERTPQSRLRSPLT